MTYDFVARISQVASLLLFFGIFLGVVAYVLWPGRSARFDAVQRSALDLDTTSNRDAA